MEMEIFHQSAHVDLFVIVGVNEEALALPRAIGPFRDVRVGRRLLKARGLKPVQEGEETAREWIDDIGGKYRIETMFPLAGYKERMEGQQSQ